MTGQKIGFKMIGFNSNTNLKGQKIFLFQPSWKLAFLKTLVGEKQKAVQANNKCLHNFHQ